MSLDKVICLLLESKLGSLSSNPFAAHIAATNTTATGAFSDAFVSCAGMALLWLHTKGPSHKLRGFAKLKKFQKCKKKLDRAHPTHPPTSNLFFGNPSLTWTEHSNHNNQQLLGNVYTDRIHMVYYSKITVLV